MIGDTDNNGLLTAQIDAATATISQGRQFSLVKYTKYTNPADGYVYWLNSGESELVAGSLHNSANQDQQQDETINRNGIIFTTMKPIKSFDAIAPDEMHVLSVTLDDPALVDSGPLLIGFNIANNYHEQSGAYHYVGQAVYPQFRQFFIDDVDDFAASLLATNSLPIILALGNYIDVPLYAAYAVPPNLETAYISVDIQASQSLQAVPAYYETATQSGTSYYVDQFKRDQIELIAYNVTQATAQKLVYQICALSDRLGTYGLANIPSWSEVDRVQSEYGLRANKKGLRMSINYWLSTAQTQLQKTITEATYSLEVE